MMCEFQFSFISKQAETVLGIHGGVGGPNDSWQGLGGPFHPDDREGPLQFLPTATSEKPTTNLNTHDRGRRQCGVAARTW